MERCPHCGAPGRPGARFCTTCGNQFSSGGGGTAALVDVEGAMTSERIDNTPTDAIESMEGWPSAPEPGEPFFGREWERRPTASAATDSESTDEPADSEATFWRETASNVWPSPPAAANAGPNPERPALEGSREFEAESEPIDEVAGNGGAEDTVARAQRLLDELRDAIGAIDRGAPPDMGGVISDLEVAVTPPGAVAPDDVTALREALLAARDRPRDLDTIIDLTQRVDAMLALIIAYDRAIAAIERSLDALRRS